MLRKAKNESAKENN
jgi:hypothetical protein